jgi:hypothetical protein
MPIRPAQQRYAEQGLESVDMSGHRGWVIYTRSAARP